MFFPSVQNPNEIGDFEVVEDGGRLHAFYLALPSHDTVGHLVSDDGIHWEPMPAAIRTGDPGDFDGDQIWTMGVCRKGDTWFMLYTALSRRGLMQKTGLAVSRDLIHWTKPAQNPVIAADARWYEAEQTGNYRVDWRDPHMVLEDGVLHGFICARQNKGLLNRRGCSGYFTSRDGYRWQVKRPACTTSNCFDWECPSVFELGGRYYMMAIAGGPGRQVYRVADRIEGPYRRPADDSLLPGTNMSVRPCLWRGKVHLFHWQRGPKDWGAVRDNYAMLASPKVARAEKDGSLTVESFDWSSLAMGTAAAVTPATPSAPSCGEWKWRGATLRGRAVDSAGIWLLRKPCADFILTADVQLPSRDAAREFGLVLRGDDTADEGLFASCIPGRYAAELVKYFYNRRRGPDSLWRGRAVSQAWHLPPAPDGRYRLRLIAFGPSVEFNVNGKLVLAFCSLPRRTGRLGLFLEDGQAAFRNVSVQPLKAPACNWDW